MPRHDCHLKARELQHLEAKKNELQIFFSGLVRSITCNIPPPMRNTTQLSHVTVYKE